MKLEEIHIGQRVVPDKSHIHHDVWKEQSQDADGNDLIGTIDKVYDDKWARVIWGDGKIYSYPPDYLLEASEKHVFQIGDIVIVNPEHEDAEKYTGQHKWNQGTIVPSYDGEATYKNAMGNTRTTVRWEHGNTNSYDVNMLIPIVKSTDIKPIATRDLQVGSRVLFNHEHEAYSTYEQQHKNNEGTIMNISSGGTISVQWDNGHRNTYSKTMLILIDEDKLQIGDTVIPNPEHKDYEKYKYQHKDSKGIIVPNNRNDELLYINTINEKWVRVRWSHGVEDNYPFDMLMLSDKHKKEGVKHVMEEQIDLKYPYLLGQRVCLNPEVDSFEYHNKDIKGNAGIIYHSAIDESNVKGWDGYSESTRKNIDIFIKFDNGAKMSLRRKDLLLVESKDSFVEIYKMMNGDTLTSYANEANKDLDKYVIDRGIGIKSKITADEAWRESLRKIVDENRNKEKKKPVQFTGW